MAMLPGAVEALYGSLSDFLAQFDEFLHAHVASVVGYHVSSSSSSSAVAAAAARAEGVNREGEGSRGPASSADSEEEEEEAGVPLSSLSTHQPRSQQRQRDPSRVRRRRARRAREPVLALSNLDSLVFNTIAFGLQQMVAAVGDIARTARRTRHAELRERVFT